LHAPGALPRAYNFISNICERAKHVGAATKFWTARQADEQTRCCCFQQLHREIIAAAPVHLTFRKFGRDNDFALPK